MMSIRLIAPAETNAFKVRSSIVIPRGPFAAVNRCANARFAAMAQNQNFYHIGDASMFPGGGRFHGVLNVRANSQIECGYLGARHALHINAKVTLM